MKHTNLKFLILFTGLLTVLPVFIPTLALAQEAVPKPAHAPMSEQSFFGNTLMFMVAGFLGYYMLVTRPQQLQEKEQQGIVDKIKKNDMVLINPGIFGKVVQIVEGEVTVDIGTSGSSLKVKVVPSALSLPATVTGTVVNKSPTKN